MIAHRRCPATGETVGRADGRAGRNGQAARAEAGNAYNA